MKPAQATGSGQALEVFFAGPPEDTVEAVLLVGDQVAPRAIGLAYRMIGPRAMMAADIGANWAGVLVCTREFAKAHKATPHAGRPDHVNLELVA